MNILYLDMSFRQRLYSCKCNSFNFRQ
uniref:Uncharacterized protein n=2 Tax=Anguilla anguilla TaxID=7936 RepID=A0A0E9VB84_ANGAN